MQSILDLLPASLWPTQPFISPDEQARTLQALWGLQAPANAFSPVAGGPSNIEGPSSLQAPDPAPFASDADHASAPGGILGSALKASAAGGILGAILGSSAAAPTATSEQDLIPPPRQGPSFTPVASTADQLAPHSPPAVAPAAPGLTHAPHPIGSIQPAWVTGAQPYFPPQNFVQPTIGPGAPWDDATRKSLVDYAVSRGIVPPSSSAAGSVTRSAADEITKEPPAGAALAPWSAKHGLLDWPVVAPLAGLTEYATRALANHIREVYSAPPDHYQMQHPGAGSLPHPQMYHLNLGTGQWDVIPAREVDPREAATVNSAVSGVGNALISPFVAFKEAWDPPLHPPPNSTFDDGGTIYVDDANGVSRPWSEVDPKAAQAYYEQERRRADFAPSFALSLLSRGAPFAEQSAVGMAGSRLTSGPRRLPKRTMETAASGASPSETATPLAQADAPTSPVFARPTLTGQTHHAISKRVWAALNQVPGLAGLYEYCDPRFMTRAIDLDAHKGYQTWHRNLDSEIAAYVRGNSLMSPEVFENYLRNRYAQPDLLARFPNGL